MSPLRRWICVQGLGKGFTMETGYVTPGKGLKYEVTLETVDVCLQVQGLGVGNLGDCGNLTSD